MGPLGDEYPNLGCDWGTSYVYYGIAELVFTCKVP